MSGLTLTETMDHVAQVFEGIGAAVLFAGLIVSIVLAVRSLNRSGDGRQA